MDKIKTFNDVKVGDTIYKVGLCGNITQHIVINIKLNHFGVKQYIFTYGVHCNEYFSIYEEHMNLYGSSSFYTTYEKAKKLAVARKKYDIQHQIKFYKEQQENLRNKLKQLEHNLLNLELDI